MSYAINNVNGQHLGFLLISGDEESGECIFRSLPNNPDVFDSEESQLLHNFQEQGEFHWNVTSNGIEITHPKTESKALINDEELRINGLILKIVNMNAS